MTQTQATEKAVAHYVRGGGNAQTGRQLLADEIARVSKNNLASSLTHWGFATVAMADRLAVAIAA